MTNSIRTTIFTLLKAMVICFLTTSVVNGQTVLTDNTNTTGFDNCTQLSLGTSVEFDSSSTCGAIIQLSYYSDPSSLIVPDTVIDYTAADIPFTLNFDRTGKYIFQCSIDPSIFPTPRFSNFADQCYDVVEPAPIPTLGEWGLMILVLLMLIISIVASRAFQIAR